ncbi:lipocalin family protein [Parvularcula sp. LCG005]|uniref:lipocalin family protein n=1 Tax=Parvularcula sp. LCG005 TaxID=3078805 RepID=UPI002941DEF4|nr:lipocalin family protein [Parvularcula sp. LCG005]WOI54625.1 lipocalin family protein [Parvularcula sp. LCG005]
MLISAKTSNAMRLPLLICPLFGLTACMNQPDYRAETAPPETVQNVDLNRYAGLWYEIARYPNSFEDKDDYTCVGVTAEYALRDDGRISVTNTCRKDTLDGAIDVAEGVARSVSDSNSKLKVKFAPEWVPFASGDYWILDLMDDYSAVLVGDPDGKYLWILSRTPDLPMASRDRLLRTAQEKGYATSPLKWVPQSNTSE